MNEVMYKINVLEIDFYNYIVDCTFFILLKDFDFYYYILWVSYSYPQESYDFSLQSQSMPDLGPAVLRKRLLILYMSIEEMNLKLT